MRNLITTIFLGNDWKHITSVYIHFMIEYYLYTCKILCFGINQLDCSDINCIKLSKTLPFLGFKKIQVADFQTTWVHMTALLGLLQKSLMPFLFGSFSLNVSDNQFKGFSIIVERILDIQNPTELYLLITQSFMTKLHLKQTRIFERELDLVLEIHAYHTPIYPTVLS